MKKPRKFFEGSEKDYLRSFEPYQYCCCFDDIKSLENEFEPESVFFTFDRMYMILSKKESQITTPEEGNPVKHASFSCELYNMTTNTTLVGTIRSRLEFGGPLGHALYFAELLTNERYNHYYLNVVKEIL